MRHLGRAHSLPPYWSQMPRFFAYPFAPNGAVFLALLALLTLGSLKLFDPSGLLILLPVFMIGALVIRQGLRVIEFCSQGRTRPPTLPELFDGNPTALKMLGLVLVYGLMVGVVGRFGWPGLIAIVFLSALLPANIMLLAIHGSLGDAVNPARALGLAARTGWSYLGLVLVLVVTAQGPQQAMALLPARTLEYLSEHSPGVLAAMVLVSSAYFNMVMSAMMGTLLFQHHDELGIMPDETEAAKPADQRALDMARAVILVREARYADALRQMGGMVADYPDDLDVLGYHHKLLCESGAEPERVVQHTERYLEALLCAQRKSRLLVAFEAARRVAPHYQPNSIPLRTALAEAYFLERKFRPAIALIGMLHKEAPQSDELPAAYYLLARIYSEGARDDGKALMILDFLTQHFPDHAMAGDIERYRKVLLSLKSAA